MLITFLLLGACFIALMEMWNYKVTNEQHQPEHASQM